MNIDEAALKVIKEVTEPLQKRIPEHIYRKIRAWLKRMHPKLSHTPDYKKKIPELIAQKTEEYLLKGTLKKNDALISVYEGGIIKMDFGQGTDDKAKKRAIEWAKKRGLKVSEASLTKSVNAGGFITFGSYDPLLSCIHRKLIKLD